MATQMTDVEQEVKGLPEDEGGYKSKPSSKKSYNKGKKLNNRRGKPESKTGKPTNDPAYYSKYPELLESSAQLNYSDPYGKLLQFNDFTSPGGNSVSMYGGTNTRAVPGVLAVRTKPTYGFNDNPRSPLNVACANLYVNLRYKVSGRKNYDAVDLGLYMGAIADLYSAINWAARCYSLAFDQSQVNMYLTSGLAYAIDVDLDDLRRNLANFRYWLNSFIERVSAYAIPKGISFFEKKIDEYSYFYIENNDKNIKDQIYVKKPAGFHMFALDNDGAGMLKFSPMPLGSGSGGRYSYNDIAAYCESLLTPIWNDEDFALISGDIIKYYEGNIIGLSNLSSESSIELTYDEMFLLQLKNSNPIEMLDEGYGPALTPSYTITGVAGSRLTCLPGNVYQDKDGVLHSLNSAPFKAGPAGVVNAVLKQDKIIDQPMPNPGLDDNMESSRMMVLFHDWANNTEGYDQAWVECPPYVITGLDLISFTGTNRDRVGSLSKYSMKPANIWILADWTSGSGLERFMMTFFKYYPSIQLWSINTVGGALKFAYRYFITNLDNFTWIPDDTLAKMHDCAWLSMFHVDGVAKVKNTLL